MVKQLRDLIGTELVIDLRVGEAVRIDSVEYNGVYVRAVDETGIVVEQREAGTLCYLPWHSVLDIERHDDDIPGTGLASKTR